MHHLLPPVIVAVLVYGVELLALHKWSRSHGPSEGRSVGDRSSGDGEDGGSGDGGNGDGCRGDGGGGNGDGGNRDGGGGGGGGNGGNDGGRGDGGSGDGGAGADRSNGCWVSRISGGSGNMSFSSSRCHVS